MHYDKWKVIMFCELIYWEFSYNHKLRFQEILGEFEMFSSSKVGKFIVFWLCSCAEKYTKKVNFYFYIWSQL